MWKGFIPSVLVVALLGCRCLSASAAAVPEFVSQARWLWSEPADNPPSNAFVRLTFDVDAPVKSAWFYRFADRRCIDFVNGKRVSLRLWPSLRDKSRGHVKGYGIDLVPFLRKGRNVLGFQLLRHELWRTYGVMLRGEVVFEDGRILKLFSNPSMAKASAVREEGWADPVFDDSAWKPAWSRGDVRMGSWTDYGSVAQIYMEEDEYKRYYDATTAGFPEKTLLSEPEATEAKIVYSGDVPGISINGGKPRPPDRIACVSLREDAWQDGMLAQARAHGLWAFQIGLTHRFQRPDGSFDFSDIDRSVRHFLAIWPEAYIYVCFSTREEVKRWLEKNPDECVRYAREDPKKSKSYGDFFGNPFVPSFASAAYRAEVRRLILDFGRYASSQSWGRRILGMHDGYGGSLDGMPFGCHSMPDTGVRMTEAFRRHLTEKYRTDDALRKSWDDPSVTLATAMVPDAKTRGGSGSFLRDLADPRDRRRADYLEAYHREFNAFELEFCKAVKDAFPGRRLSGLYYGYMVLSYEPEGSTARCEELLKSPYVDYMLATTRGYNFADGLHRHLHSMFHRYGKLSSIEGDVRTHLGLAYGDSERQWTCLTPEETRATVGKYAMNARMFGTGWHAVDFSAKKWSNCPEALETLAASRKVWEADFADPPSKAADVAVVLDPDQIWREGSPYLTKTRSYQETLVTFPLQSLDFSGFANDMFAVEDYVACPRRYRAVIFLNTCYDTPALRKAASKARTDGAMSIWCGTPGISTSSGWSEASMFEITGIRLGIEREEHRFVAVGTDGRAGYVPHDNVYVPKYWVESPRVFVDDGDAKVLAKWKDNGKAAFAVKRLADGTDTVFLGMPYNSVSQWAELLASAGCHAFTGPGFMVRRNSRRLMVFSARGGNTSYEISVLTNQMSQAAQVPVKLERPYARVRDSMTGETVAENVQSLTLTSETTRLWMLETE